MTAPWQAAAAPRWCQLSCCCPAGRLWRPACPPCRLQRCCCLRPWQRCRGCQLASLAGQRAQRGTMLLLALLLLLLLWSLPWQQAQQAQQQLPSLLSPQGSPLPAWPQLPGRQQASHLQPRRWLQPLLDQRAQGARAGAPVRPLSRCRCRRPRLKWSRSRASSLCHPPMRQPCTCPPCLCWARTPLAASPRYAAWDWGCCGSLL